MFAKADGFLRTELWAREEGAFLTLDHWRSHEDFERFQRDFAIAYLALDAALEEIAGVEAFVGVIDT